MSSSPADVTVIIPTIPPRADLLERAVASVQRQDYPGKIQILTYADEDHLGPAHARNRLLDLTTSEWVAFLDDDDEFHPHHLSTLMNAREGHDVIYPWFDFAINGRISARHDPLRLHGKHVIGQPFDAEALRHSNYIPVTLLDRTELIQSVGGFVQPKTEEWPHESCEDWGTWLRLVDAGARFHHVPERTWIWHKHSNNTSGRPDNWR